MRRPWWWHVGLAAARAQTPPQAPATALSYLLNSTFTHLAPCPVPPHPAGVCDEAACGSPCRCVPLLPGLRHKPSSVTRPFPSHMLTVGVIQASGEQEGRGGVGVRDLQVSPGPAPASFTPPPLLRASPTCPPGGTLTPSVCGAGLRAGLFLGLFTVLPSPRHLSVGQQRLSLTST